MDMDDAPKARKKGTGKGRIQKRKSKKKTHSHVFPVRTRPAKPSKKRG